MRLGVADGPKGGNRGRSEREIGEYFVRLRQERQNWSDGSEVDERKEEVSIIVK